MCDGLIGAFHGGGGGVCKSAYFVAPFASAHTCLRCFLWISFLIFFEKISWLSGVVGGWLWCYHFMAGVHFFADIDQADLLGGGVELLG